MLWNPLNCVPPCACSPPRKIERRCWERLGSPQVQQRTASTEIRFESFCHRCWHQMPEKTLSVLLSACIKKEVVHDVLLLLR